MPVTKQFSPQALAFIKEASGKVRTFLETPPPEGVGLAIDSAQLVMDHVGTWVNNLGGEHPEKRLHVYRHCDKNVRLAIAHETHQPGTDPDVRQHSEKVRDLIHTAYQEHLGPLPPEITNERTFP